MSKKGMFITAGILFITSCLNGSINSGSPAQNASPSISGTQTDEFQAPDNKPAAPEFTEGYRELSAFAQAYPGKIKPPEFRGDDWAVLVGDTWYFWANGRILPENLRSKWEDYSKHPFS